MDCPQCGALLKKQAITVEGVRHLLISYQCKHCSYCDLDAASAEKILHELCSL
ncbi:MAG: hypothetical protein AABX86_01560 [Nanoarchaeota archaeon]